MESKINGTQLVITLDNDLVASYLDEQLNSTKAILKENPDAKEVVLDMQNVNEIDSLGINLVVGIYKQVAGEKKKFKTTNVSKPIKNLF
ncbi:MAG: STAS domain-containing protein, partial [Candidatus Cloacimonadota bacterium]|nr:STAS domain-containing protein [Candidatus Cloacimonadota bacterium]